MLGDILYLPVGPIDLTVLKPYGVLETNLVAGIPVELRKGEGGDLSLTYRTFFHRPSTWLVGVALVGAFFIGKKWG